MFDYDILGAFEVGVMKKLLEEGPDLDYYYITGVSAGALNAGVTSLSIVCSSLPSLSMALRTSCGACRLLVHVPHGQFQQWPSGSGSRNVDDQEQ